MPGLADLPEPPDLAVLSVRNERLEETLAAAIAVGTRAAVIFASGLLRDERSAARRAARRESPRTAGIPVCGPNCMGFYNDLDGVWICGFPSPREPAPGSIAFIAHSGSVFGALAHNDPRLRFALRRLARAAKPRQRLPTTSPMRSNGREVKVIGLFIETARDPQAFAQALTGAAQRGVPVVALKVGRTEASAAAALTHTGASAGSDLAYDALFERHGVIRVETLDELGLDLAVACDGTARRAGRARRHR